MKLDIVKELRVKFEGTYVSIKEFNKKEYIFFIEELSSSFIDDPTLGTNIKVEGVMYSEGKKYGRSVNLNEVQFFPLAISTGYVQLNKSAYYILAGHLKQWKRSYSNSFNISPVVQTIYNVNTKQSLSLSTGNTLHKLYISNLNKGNKIYCVKEGIRRLYKNKFLSVCIHKHIALCRSKDLIFVFYKNHNVGILKDMRVYIPDSISFLKRDLQAMLKLPVEVKAA